MADGDYWPQRTHDPRPLSLELRQWHRANASGDLRFDDTGGIVARIQRADVDRHVRPWRAGDAAHQSRRARVAFGEKDVTRTQQSRQREHVMGCLRGADRLGEKAREGAGNAREGTRQ